jgi:hypothetical protein
MKPGRNDPCPCGSGKKYKKCCLDKDFDKTTSEDSLRKKLIPEILEFAQKKLKHLISDAYSFYWDEFDPEEYIDDQDTMQMADINFLDWFICDWESEDGEKVIDSFIVQNRYLKEDELIVLNKLRESIISLYEIQEVFPDKGFIAKDLLLGGNLEIRDRSASRSLVRWDVIAARVTSFEDIYIMPGSIYPYSQGSKDEIIEGIMECFDDYKLDYTDVALRDFLKDEGSIFNFFWCENILNPPEIKLHTTTGEPFLFSKAVFNIKDKGALIAGLKAAENIDEDNESEFIWYVEQQKMDMRTVLGRILLHGDTLTLETNSKERLERGMKLILTIAKGSVVHKINSFESPKQAMKRHKETPLEKPENEIPQEVQQTIYTEYMQKHYEQWIYDKIPAFDNKTPVEASRTKKGREKVKQLLKEIENNEERNKKMGEPYYDISWMWERLKIDK